MNIGRFKITQSRSIWLTEEEQTTQWKKEKVGKANQRSLNILIKL